MGKFIDLTGQIVNGVKAIEYLGDGMWLTECQRCGKVVAKPTQTFKHGGCFCGKYKTIDVDYFKVVDTRKKAYFLGFLWADGYNSVEHVNCKIDLQERDKDILEKLKEDCHFSGNILPYTVKKGESYRPEDAVICRLSIKNKDFIQNLAEKGVVAHREEAHFPYKFVPKEFYIDFIRGYFDGNGSISYPKEKGVKCLLVTVCGGTNIVKDISEIVNEKFGYKVTYHYRKKENPKNISAYFCSNHQERVEFLGILYEDAPVYLNRKYEKYKEVLSLLK